MNVESEEFATEPVPPEHRVGWVRVGLISAMVAVADLTLPWGNSGSRILGELARSIGARTPIRLVSSAKSWLCHPGIDRRSAVLPPGARSLHSCPLSFSTDRGGNFAGKGSGLPRRCCLPREPSRSLREVSMTLLRRIFW